MNEIEKKIQDPKSVAILAKSLYREVRASGYSGEDVMHLAGELLSLLTREVKTGSSRATVG
jgi:hypothetical protein